MLPVSIPPVEVSRASVGARGCRASGRTTEDVVERGGAGGDRDEVCSTGVAGLLDVSVYAHLINADTGTHNSVAVVKPIGISLAAVWQARIECKSAPGRCLPQRAARPMRLTVGEDLVRLGLRDALDGEEDLLGRERDGLDRVVTRLGELLAVLGRESVLL